MEKNQILAEVQEIFREVLDNDPHPAYRGHREAFQDQVHQQGDFELGYCW